VRLHISGAKTVKLHVAVSNFVFTDVELEEKGSDIFEGTIPFNEKMTGPANVNVYVNGAEVLVPDLPIIWTDNRPQNNIEIPDEGDDYLLIKDVPHGTLARELIFSHSTGAWERCMVYTPAGYRKSSEALPVLYLLHGGGDNDQMWEYVGKMSHTLDNLWAEGKAKKFVVVMMNGMLRAGGRVGNPVDSAFEQMLINDCIPFIEGNFNVLTDKWNRAIAGLSMGAYMSCDIGFAHPELFGSIGTFTASMTHEGVFASYERPYPKTLAEGSERFGENYKLYWRSTTPQENHLDFFLEDDKLLKDAGIYYLPCHHRKLYEPNTSKWNSWRMGLRDFATLVFNN
jgi:enterochelin esterase family protein